jgi:hypothetical protein
MLVLSGCAAGPSDSVVEAALEARIEAMNSPGQAPQVTVASAKNRQCHRVGDEGAWLCDVDVVIAMEGLRTTQGVAQLRMIPLDEGWTGDPLQTLSIPSTPVK